MCFAYWEKHHLITLEPGFSCVFMCTRLVTLSWTRQLVWIFQRLWERDPPHPIDVSTRGILRCHLLQLQLTPENIYSAETDAGTPTSCCLSEMPWKIRDSVQDSPKQLTWFAHTPTHWPGEAIAPSSKTGKLMTAVEALAGKLRPVQPWNQCLFHSFRQTTSPVPRVSKDNNTNF